MGTTKTKDVKCKNHNELKSILLRNRETKTLLNLDLREWEGEKIRLAGVRVANIDLSGVTMEEDIILYNADVWNINLEKSTTGKVDLIGATTKDINLKGAKVRKLILSYAETGDVELDGASIEEVYLDGTDTRKINSGKATIEKIWDPGLITGLTLVDLKFVGDKLVKD